MTEQHHRTLRVRSARDLRHKRGLPHPGLTRDEYDLAALGRPSSLTRLM